MYPFGRHIALVTKRGPLTVDFPPFFAFALAIIHAIERTPGFDKKATKGDALALSKLLLTVLLEYGLWFWICRDHEGVWRGMLRLGRSVAWTAFVARWCAWNIR